MTGPAKLAKKAMRHKVIATRLAAEGLPLPVPLDAVVRDLRPMPLALDTGTAWKVWAAARGYADDHIEALMSALPSLVASTGYLIEVRRAGSRRWDADGNAVGEVSDEHRRAAAVTLADRKARREAGGSRPPRPCRRRRSVSRSRPVSSGSQSLRARLPPRSRSL